MTDWGLVAIAYVTGWFCTFWILLFLSDRDILDSTALATIWPAAWGVWLAMLIWRGIRLLFRWRI